MTHPYLFTYDVFDTALTRLVAKPHDLFLLTARLLRQRGLLALSPPECRNARIFAESNARRIRGGSEVSLDDIAIELAQTLGIDADVADCWIKAEVDLEQRLCCGVPMIQSEITAARAANAKIHFISDMYLPSGLIRDMLIRENLATASDLVWVSGTEGVSKRSGALYKRVASTSQQRHKGWVHHGDRRDSDVEIPRKLGIRAVHRTHCELNHFERVLQEHADATDGEASLLAGTSRLTRLTVTADNTHERGLVSVAAGVIGPVLVSYVLWILRTAQRKKIRRLYFAARDGYLLLAIARRLEITLQTGTDLRYLYGSRQAWHLPALTEFDDPTQLDWLTVRSCREITISHVLQRLGFTPIECETLIASAKRREQFPTDSQELLENILRQADVLATVRKRSKEARQIARTYFAQEGLFDDIPWGLVDVGWRARAQRSLRSILGKSDVHGFYFGLREGASGSEAGTAEAYLFDGRSGSGSTPDFSAFDAVLEMFCQAPHGMTLGYQADAGHILPVFREQSNHKVVSWGLPKVHETVLAFVDRFPADLASEITDLRPCVIRVLEEFWWNPTFEEACAWGDFGVESDQRMEIRRTLAPSLGVRDILNCLFRGGRASSPWVWKSAVDARSSATSKLSVKFAKMVHGVASRLSPFTRNRTSENRH